MNHIESFRSALASAGIPIQVPLKDDGVLHRYKGGEDREPNSWYVLYPPNPVSAGAYGCHKRQIHEKWKDGNGHIDPKTLAECQKKWREAEVQRVKDEQERHERTAGRAKELFDNAEKVVSHLYLEAKQVGAHGNLRLVDGDLFMPLSDVSGKIWSAQTVDALGDKLFMPGGRVTGCMFWVYKRKLGPILVCEGYATGASLYEATGFSVCCAMNCGNLLAVCKDVRRQYPDRQIVVCADDDWKTEGNPGLTKGTAAAESVKGLLISPKFPDGFKEARTDFNDLHVAGGLSEVKIQILLALEYPLARPIGDLQPPPKDDPEELLKYRFLCRAGGLLVVGPTGIGKSSFVLQMLALLANGMPAFGIEPTRPLRSIYIQAENDDGDIAEIRDGIAKGLEFDETKRARFFERVIVHTENATTGRRFFDEVVIPLIISNPGLDLLVIDPALSFIGAEAGNQKSVGEFLREMLTPVLARHRMAAIVVHHTNKPPSGNQKPDWTTSEMAYLGSGSIEWANWARAILALQSTKTAGVFKLNAAKRGARLNWKNDEENRVYHQLIKHFKSDKVICWLPASPEDEESTQNEGGRPRKTELEDFVSLIEHESMTPGEWMVQAKGMLGISRATFYRLIDAAEKEGKILKSKVNGKWTFVRSNGV